MTCLQYFWSNKCSLVEHKKTFKIIKNITNTTFVNVRVHILAYTTPLSEFPFIQVLSSGLKINHGLKTCLITVHFYLNLFPISWLVCKYNKWGCAFKQKHFLCPNERSFQMMFYTSQKNSLSRHYCAYF